MDTPILVVVDMQPNFRAANHLPTIAACQSLIQEAMIKTNPIFFLEYVENGNTLPELFNLTKGFDLKFQLTKSSDSGARVIATQLKRCRVVPKKFIVCGVNTAYCVFSTVRGLLRSKHNYHIDVIKQACNDEHTNGVEAFNRMQKLPRVQVV